MVSLCWFYYGECVYVTKVIYFIKHLLPIIMLVYLFVEDCEVMIFHPSVIDVI